MARTVRAKKDLPPEPRRPRASSKPPSDPTKGPSEIWHMRCPLCGLQSRLTENPPVKPDLPRMEDGPFHPEVRHQTIGGAMPAIGDYPAAPGFSEWGPPEELNGEQLQFLKERMSAATALVADLKPTEELPGARPPWSPR